MKEFYIITILLFYYKNILLQIIYNYISLTLFWNFFLENRINKGDDEVFLYSISPI